MREDELLSTPTVAEMLNVPVPTLRYWRFMGTGPRSFKLGPRNVRYKRSDVLAWLEAQYAETVKVSA